MVPDSRTERIDELIWPGFKKFQGQVATIDDRESLTYEQVGEHATRQQESLVALGIQRDEPVLVVVENRGRDLANFLGVWRAGGVVVPVHSQAVAATAEHIITLTKARLVVTSTTFPPGFGRDAGWEERASGQLRTRLCAAPERDPMLCGAALVVCTSGTTGKAKGVVLGHRGYVGKLRSIVEPLHAVPGMKMLLALQLTFSFGQWTSLSTLWQGGTIRLVPKFEAQRVRDLLATETYDWFPVVPTMMRALMPLYQSECAQRGVESLLSTVSPKMWMAGGEPLPAQLGKAFRRLLPRCGIADVYGLTETNSADFILRPADYDRHAGSIGFCGDGIAFRIVDLEGRECLTGQEGELEVRTPYVMRGYLRNPEATDGAFHDGFLRTGDLAYVDDHGAVRLAGRAKEIICKAGNKISPLEVEEALLSLPAVAAAAVGAVPDATKGEVIGAVIVPAKGSELVERSIREELATLLEKYKIPDRIEIADRLPLGPTGKLDRRAVRSRFG